MRKAFAVGAAFACVSADQCDTPGSQRQDCGVLGTKQGQCEAKGCCWNPSNDGSPWCFHKGGPGPSPSAKCSLKYTSTGAPFSEDEVAKIRGFFLANIDIQGSGAVVAAPDHNTGPGGDYYFHWERDGALTMDALMRTNPGKVSDVETQLKHYVQWVEKVQNQPDPHGIDIRTEPKYTIPDGKPFAGSWCRPQNDGPGLRGKSLAEFGMALLARGEKGDADFVKEHLWTGTDAKHGGLVKYDLDWQADNWQSTGCDLWEEIQSNDFFWNRYTMRASLMIGADFAEKMGDAASAAKYRNVAKTVEGKLNDHFDGTFVFESQNRRKDAAVIEAFNDGDLNDGLFAPLSKEVLGTVITLNELFCDTFQINQKDTAANIPGILYGRYAGDTYDGGNPWVLLSATLAQLIYRQAGVASKTTVDASTYALLQKAYDIEDGLSGKALGDALMGAGDGVMIRIKHHVEATGLHMAEQITRDEGQMSSAKDLTWNYANVLKALHARGEYALAAITNTIVV